MVPALRSTSLVAAAGCVSASPTRKSLTKSVRSFLLFAAPVLLLQNDAPCAEAQLRAGWVQGASGSGEGVPLLQQQQQQQVALQDTYYSTRAEALQNVESTIVELGGIFQQLAHMVRHFRGAFFSGMMAGRPCLAASCPVLGETVCQTVRNAQTPIKPWPLVMRFGNWNGVCNASAGARAGGDGGAH